MCVCTLLLVCVCVCVCVYASASASACVCVCVCVCFEADSECCRELQGSVFYLRRGFLLVQEFPSRALCRYEQPELSTDLHTQRSLSLSPSISLFPSLSLSTHRQTD